MLGKKGRGEREVIDYKKYPPNWKKEIRPRILKRANNKCEFCGIKNYGTGYRNEDGLFFPDVSYFRTNSDGKITRERSDYGIPNGSRVLAFLTGKSIGMEEVIKIAEQQYAPPVIDMKAA